MRTNKIKKKIIIFFFTIGGIFQCNDTSIIEKMEMLQQDPYSFFPDSLPLEIVKDGLESWWNLNFNQLFDNWIFATANQDGTPTGGTTVSDASRYGFLDDSIRLNSGASVVIDFMNSPAWDGPASTISFWVKFGSFPTAKLPFLKRFNNNCASAPSGFQTIIGEAGQLSLEYSQGNTCGSLTANTLEVGKWYYISLILNGPELSIFVIPFDNPQSPTKNSVVDLNYIPAFGSNLVFNNTTDVLTIWYDDAVVYSRALSNTQIQRNFRSRQQ